MAATKNWLKDLGLPPKLAVTAEEALEITAGRWREIDSFTFENQLRVLDAMRSERICEEDFHDSSGYGYNDRGREKLDRVYARVFQAEDALVRTHLVSGTHALAVALFGLLRPGDLLLCLTGPPYETLQAVMGTRGGEEEGTLEQWGIRCRYRQTDHTGAAVEGGLENEPAPAAAYIQRSGGYALDREALTTEQVGSLIQHVHSRWPGIPVIVDNCYGEFVETDEPTSAGADLIVGSLIKNPGGGLAPCGGYMAGRGEMVRKVAARLTAPGLYGNIGALTGKRNLFQGIFMAPSLVANALKNALFAAALFEIMGYKVKPRHDELRGDIVQAIILEDPEKVKLFCRAVQQASPVESYLVPEPGKLPGYTDPVIMAAGTFYQGASSELSADAPMRKPYAVFLQGGLTLPHALYATCCAAGAIWAPSGMRT